VDKQSKTQKKIGTRVKLEFGKIFGGEPFSNAYRSSAVWKKFPLRRALRCGQENQKTKGHELSVGSKQLQTTEIICI
jgi:hypothetical protein